MNPIQIEGMSGAGRSVGDGWPVFPFTPGKIRPLAALALGQHRTMGTAGFGGSFAPIVQYEKWEIHPVFPHFSYFRLCQNISPNLLAPLCGAALDFKHILPKNPPIPMVTHVL
ncbi:MAG: hypothetical protein SPE19_09420 [Candidatus Faecousia sp.]|nr:hypothetical protein [Candidatus Faecousia sp.]